MTKDNLMALLNRARAAELAMLDNVSAQEREASGTFERWAPKEVLAHISFWRSRSLNNLARVQRGEEPDNTGEVEFDEINRATFDRNVGRSLEDILAESNQVFEAFITQLNRFGDEELFERNRYPLPGGASVARRALGNAYDHAAAHVGNFYLQRGDRARAFELLEASTAALLEFDTSPEGRGNALYNLACFYSLAGDSDRAIELLREALMTRPDLVEWSKQDTDLDSLRELPAFQGLYTS